MNKKRISHHDIWCLYLALLLSCIFPIVAFASKSTTRLGDQPSKESPKSLAWSLGYSLSTDMADKVEPRIYSHKLIIGGAYQSELYGQLEISTSMDYESANQEVSESEQINEFYLSDITTAWSKTWLLGTWLQGKHDFSTSSSFAWPNSPDSQARGYNGILTLSGQTGSKWKQIFGLSFGLRAAQYFQTYESSPVAPYEVNKNNEFSYQSRGAVYLNQYFNIYGTVGTTFTRYLDGLYEQSYYNGVGLGFQYDNRLLAKLETLNGNYPDEQDIDLLFYDEYRRITRFTLILLF